MRQLTFSIFVGAFLTFVKGKMDQDSVSQPDCTNRFEYRHELKEKRFKSCDEIRKDNIYCAKNYTVAYSNLPPYAFYDETDKKVKGILPGNIG